MERPSARSSLNSSRRWFCQRAFSVSSGKRIAAAAAAAATAAFASAAADRLDVTSGIERVEHLYQSVGFRRAPAAAAASASMFTRTRFRSIFDLNSACARVSPVASAPALSPQLRTLAETTKPESNESNDETRSDLSRRQSQLISQTIAVLFFSPSISPSSDSSRSLAVASRRVARLRRNASLRETLLHVSQINTSDLILIRRANTNPFLCRNEVRAKHSALICRLQQSTQRLSLAAMSSPADIYETSSAHEDEVFIKQLE